MAFHIYNTDKCQIVEFIITIRFLYMHTYILEFLKIYIYVCVAENIRSNTNISMACWKDMYKANILVNFCKQISFHLLPENYMNI